LNGIGVKMNPVWEVLDEKLLSYTSFAFEIDGLQDRFQLSFFVKAGLF
jgi:hypothetical protein